MKMTLERISDGWQLNCEEAKRIAALPNEKS